MQGKANSTPLNHAFHAWCIVMCVHCRQRVVYVNMDACMASQLVTMHVIEALQVRPGLVVTRVECLSALQDMLQCASCALNGVRCQCC